MALSAKLQLRQTQSLAMTPQLLQSIRMLQLTHVELQRFIDEEIERNPLLERVETPQDGTDQAAPDATSDAVEQMPLDVAEGSGFDAVSDWSAEAISDRLDTSLDNIFPDDPGTGDRLAPDLAGQWKSARQSVTAGSGAPVGFDMDDMAAPRRSLRDHISQQIAFAFADPLERLIAGELADGLDEAGYLRIDPDEVADRLGAGRQAVLTVLAVCQTFEPTGVFATDLAQCLSLQLAGRNRLDPAMATLVANLEFLARRDFQVLKRLCGVDEEDLLDMLAEIRALDPRPGLAFCQEPSDTIVPDVEVRANNDGSWSVELNLEALPRVLVDQAYFAVVSGHARSRAEKDFLTECLQSANWLTRSLDQRARTILKVASEIVRQQDDFLVHGVRRLKPLNLKAVADAIGMHESTVSRVTANKYMLTPRGMFELRYFFTASIASSDGGGTHSSEAVRDRIRQMVAEEDAAGVLSDDAIVERLKADGVDIARRTVAKYREGMNIPSSVQRRREKRAFAGAGR